MVLYLLLKHHQSRRRLAVDNPPSQQMEMSMLQQVVPRQDNYAQSRAVALHNVESTISELGSIFTHLATMVAQQGELAIRFALFAWIYKEYACMASWILPLIELAVLPFFWYLIDTGTDWCKQDRR